LAETSHSDCSNISYKSRFKGRIPIYFLTKFQGCS
jgi:hypothetical protein